MILTKSGEYLLYSVPHQQVTPIGDDGWWIVHHTTHMPYDWWAVRHKCADGTVHGMKFVTESTQCRGCHAQLPPEIDGFLILLQWEK